MAISHDQKKSTLGERTQRCDVHGAFTSIGQRYLGNREFWTTCPDCEEARLARDRQAEAEEHARRESERLEEAICAAQIPARFVGRGFDDYLAETPAQQKALQACRAFADGFWGHLKRGSSLLLLGGVGTGKTHLACAILQAIVPEHRGMYTSVSRVVRAVRGTWRRDSEISEAEVLSRYSEVALLVLDEVGVQAASDNEQNILFEVLDRRYRDLIPNSIQ